MRHFVLRGQHDWAGKMARVRDLPEWQSEDLIARRHELYARASGVFRRHGFRGPTMKASTLASRQSIAGMTDALCSFTAVVPGAGAVYARWWALTPGADNPLSTPTDKWEARSIELRAERL